MIYLRKLTDKIATKRSCREIAKFNRSTQR